METKPGAAEAADFQPDFYDIVVGSPLTTEQIEKARNQVEVKSIDTALERIKEFPAATIIMAKFDIIGVGMAIIQDPYGNVVFLSEREELL